MPTQKAEVDRETCEDILRTKGRSVYTVPMTARVFEAVEEMSRRRVGALLVSVEGAPRGIISERDVITRVLLVRLALDEVTVAEVMTRDVVCVEPTTTQGEAMALMTRRRCRHLPVVVDGAVVGMISIGDLVRSASRDQEVEVKLLSEYIHGA